MQPVPQNFIPHKKTLAECDFFVLIKLEHLSETEKNDKLNKLKRLAFLHFLNLDLPSLLSTVDLQELEKMTANIHTIDLNKIQVYLKTKIPNLDAILEEKLNHIKLEALIHHYETELSQLKLIQQTTKVDYLVQILAVERLLSAILMKDWTLVKATVPYTKTNSG